MSLYSLADERKLWDAPIGLLALFVKGRIAAGLKACNQGSYNTSAHEFRPKVSQCEEKSS